MGNKQTMDGDTKNLIYKLNKLRDARNDRIKCNNEVLKSLNYEKERKPYEFDAFLVKAVDIRFKESQDADIALMAFGLLQGYRYEQTTTVTERRYRYLKESDYLPDDLRQKIKPYNEATKEEKDALTGNLRKGRENTCIKWLADFLLDQSSIEKFIEEIDDYIDTVDGKKIAKLPEPSYLKNKRVIQNEYADGNNVGDGLDGNNNFQTTTKQEPENNLAWKSNVEQEKSEQSTIDGGAGGQVESYSEEQNGTGSKKLLQTIREKAKALIGFLKIRLKAKDIVVIFILLFTAAGIWEIAQSLRSRNTEATNSTAMTENESLTITGITIYNADITLTPDKPWEELRVSIYPREANIDDVNYYSDNIHLVTVNRNTERVRLAPEWKKQTEQSTKVHVQFEEIDAEALISVQESQDDSTASPGESSLGGNNSDEVKNTSGF